MTCVETLFNPDLNSCKKTIKGHLEKVELRGNIRENCYLWVFLHLSFYFEIIFKMHAVIRKTRKIPATLCPAPSMVTFCKTVVQYHSGKITKYSQDAGRFHCCRDLFRIVALSSSHCLPHLNPPAASLGGLRTSLSSTPFILSLCSWTHILGILLGLAFSLSIILWRFVQICVYQ